MFLMQATSSTTGDLVTWQSAGQDFAGASFPGPGSPLYIAVASQIDQSGSGDLQIVNIVDYGGDGNGTADNTGAIAAAIAQLAENGCVYFPPGTYRFSSTQSWAANVWFAHGASISVDTAETVTIEGSIDANDYQQIFEGSGSIVLETTSTISVCWFGADPSGNVSATAAAIQDAINACITGHSEGVGTLTMPIFFPQGVLGLEKPIVVSANGIEVVGAGKLASILQARSYCGPALLVSAQPTFTLHTNDYAGGNSATVGDGPRLRLNRYGQSWNLLGLGALCMEFVLQIGTQTQTTFFLDSSGSGGAGPGSTDAAFHIGLLGSDYGFSNSNPGLQWTLKTTSGTVVATTSAGALASGSWVILRLDWDGSNMRIFVNGVAQTLTTTTTSAPQTGTIVQQCSEAVILGMAYPSGYDGYNPVFNLPTGFKVASMRLSWASRGSANYSAPTAKFTEDSTTKFLLNFDIVQAQGGLHFARAWGGSSFGLMNAWIPNDSDGTQIAPFHAHDFAIECDNGVCISANAVPQCAFKELRLSGQSGLALNSNCYNSTVERCDISSTGGFGTGIYVGSASNYTAIRDCHVNGFYASVYSESMIDCEGWNYFATPVYCGLFFENVLIADIKNIFLSDEAGPHALYGAILYNCGTVHFDGVLFGFNQHTDQTQVWIKGAGSVYKNGHFKFTACAFGNNDAGLAAVRVSTIGAGDEVSISSCDYFSPQLLAVDSDALGRITVEPWEHAKIAITLSDANTTLTQDEWQYGKIVFSGTLTADRNIVVPTIDKYQRTIQNQTSHALLVKTSSGTGIYIPPGQTGVVSCDGTNVIKDSLEGTTLRIITSGSSSTANNWDQFISLKQSGVYDLTTPPNPVKGQPLIVKDQEGDAGTNNKTISAYSGHTIDGATTAVIAVDFGKAALCFDGVSDWMS